LATDRIRRGWKISPPPDAILPLVLVAKIDNAMRLTAVDAKAARLGLSTGMALASARAMVPTVKVVAADEAADGKLLSQIADWCDRFSPFVAIDPPYGFLLDVTGTSHLFGGEADMLKALQAAMQKLGFAVSAAMAGSPLAAHALARHRPGTIVPIGRDQEAMAGLPIDALGLEAVNTHAFRRAGLKKIGQVASRKRTELTSRFGSEMVFRLDAALGAAETPISPRMPLASYRVEHRFAEPVATEAVMLATITKLAAYLAKMLEERGEGARALQAVFFRADGMVRRIAVETGAPTREPSIFARLFREKMASLADPLDPGFGYDLIRLEVSLSQPCRDEAAELGSNAAQEKEVRQLIDRLAARFGSHRILVFRPNDTHIPERAFKTVPAQQAEPFKGQWETRRAKEAPRRPLRMFLPERISFEEAPLRFRWRTVTHKIRHIEGPERIAMEWWRAPGPARDYYRAEDEEGCRYWLYKEESRQEEGRWFLHGVFA
jgi:protein ImuB